MKWIKNNYWLLIILIAFLFVSYFHLGRDLLYDWDEGIYGEIAREIKFPFLQLSWNGDPWFEKPFLVPLLASLSFTLLGVSEFAARFFMPIFGVLAIFFTYKLAEKYCSKKNGLFSAVFFFFASLFLSRSRGLNTDIILLFSLTSSLFYFKNIEDKIEKGNKIKLTDCLLIAFLISIGILAKGVMGFLPVVIWGTYLLFFRRDLIFSHLIKIWLIIGGLVVLFVVPWHIYMTLCFGRQFWNVYLIEQVLRRAYQPIDYHFGGRLYYLKFLWEEFRWKLVFPVFGGIYLVWDSLREKKIDKGLSFLIVWGLLVFFLFTFSKTKLFWYILPLYPVLAIFFGVFWTKVIFIKNEILITLIFLAMIMWGVKNGLSQAGLNSERVINPKNKLAIEASSSCYAPLLFLVDKNERQARDILPVNLKLSSSFSYGGAPSVVFYYKNKVDFFYDVDKFFSSFSRSKDGDCAMISTADYQLLGLKDSLESKIVKKEDQWLLIRK